MLPPYRGGLGRIGPGRIGGFMRSRLFRFASSSPAASTSRLKGACVVAWPDGLAPHCAHASELQVRPSKWIAGRLNGFHGQAVAEILSYNFSLYLNGLRFLVSPLSDIMAGFGPPGRVAWLGRFPTFTIISITYAWFCKTGATCARERANA